MFSATVLWAAVVKNGPLNDKRQLLDYLVKYFQPMKPRIIICGLGHTGYKIFCLLRQQGALVVGISDRPLPDEGPDVVVGDLQAASTLLAAGIQDART